MKIAVLIIQFLITAKVAETAILALLFSKEKLYVQFPFSKEFSTRSLKYFGWANAASALAMLIASLFFNWNLLAGVTAIAISFLLLAAIIYHSFRREYFGLSVNVILLSCCIFVVYNYAMHYTQIAYSIYQYAY